MKSMAPPSSIEKVRYTALKFILRKFALQLAKSGEQFETVSPLDELGNTYGPFYLESFSNVSRLKIVKANKRSITRFYLTR